MHREVKGSDITPNIVLQCLISAIIKENALLLHVLPWEQLGDGSERVLSSDGWWLLSTEMSQGTEVFSLCQSCGPWAQGTGRVQSVFLEEFLC